jgi:pullulanase/glycogen debranching enzyme
MVKLLHEAGIEVLLDVVYNHTAEEGPEGPTTSFRGIDNASYYRQTSRGTYIDVTGCGNSINTATPAVSRMILDSLRFWANEVQVDGFRFDLAATLGRNADHYYDPTHPLLHAGGVSFLPIHHPKIPPMLPPFQLHHQIDWCDPQTQRALLLRLQYLLR